MLSLFSIYKSMSERGNEQVQAAYKAYITCKRQYRQHLNQAKRQAVEKFIEDAPNQCKVAWDVISQEQCLSRTQHLTLDPQELNHYFTNSVKELVNTIPDTNTVVSDFLGQVHKKKTISIGRKSTLIRKDIHSHDTRNKTKLDTPQHRLAKLGSSYLVLALDGKDVCRLL
uniref:Uncharacterized protein n=1 Tax=Graphocephala atropunctata TaxID=36148 RepID=A0A1B6LUR4_9HEMI